MLRSSLRVEKVLQPHTASESAQPFSGIRGRHCKSDLKDGRTMAGHWLKVARGNRSGSSRALASPSPPARWRGHDMPEVMEDALKRILESCKWDALSAAGCIRCLQPLCNRRPSLMDRYGTSDASALHAHRAQQGAPCTPNLICERTSCVQSGGPLASDLHPCPGLLRQRPRFKGPLAPGIWTHYTSVSRDAR